MTLDISNLNPPKLDKLKLSLCVAIVVLFASISFVITRNLIQYRQETVGLPSEEVETPTTPVIPGDSDFEILSEQTSIPVSLPAAPQLLTKPQFSIPAGIYRETQFPLKVHVSNPNPGSTWVMISVNNRGYRELSAGRSVSINPGDRLRAYVRGDTEKWQTSETESAVYRKKIEPKTIPRMPRFRPDQRR